MHIHYNTPRALRMARRYVPVRASEVSARDQREVDRGAGSAAEGRGSPAEANHTDRAGRSATGRAGRRAREEARTARSESVGKGEEGGGGARAENEFVRTNSPSTTAIVGDGFSATTPSITSNEKCGHPARSSCCVHSARASLVRGQWRSACAVVSAMPPARHGGCEHSGESTSARAWSDELSPLRLCRSRQRRIEVARFSR
jgi:hypothetical protein